MRGVSGGESWNIGKRARNGWRTLRERKDKKNKQEIL
jgi:hypothetical protein